MGWGPCKDDEYTCDRAFLDDHEEVVKITDLRRSLMGISFRLKSHGGRRHLGKTFTLLKEMYDFNLLILLWCLTLP